MRSLFLSIIIFSTAVAAVMAIKKCSLKDSVHICRDFIWQIICELVGWDNQPTPKYPVHVGFDGYNIIPHLVDVEFREMLDSFPVCYCDSFRITEHTIEYFFPVMFPSRMDVDESTFYLLIQKKAEKCVADHLKRYSCYVPAEPLTAVELQTEYMLITLAFDQIGIEQVRAFKSRKRQNAFQKQREETSAEDFTEKWENSDE